MIKKILFPTDGSDSAKKAQEHAIEMALKFNATIIAIYVYELPGEVVDIIGAYNSTFAYLNEIENNLREYGDSILKDTQEIFNSRGVKVETLLLKGEPGNAIADTIISENCDLVIMGSKGMSTIKSILVGSISNYVIHHSKCPIMLIH